MALRTGMLALAVLTGVLSACGGAPPSDSVEAAPSGLQTETDTLTVGGTTFDVVTTVDINGVGRMRGIAGSSGALGDVHNPKGELQCRAHFNRDGFDYSLAIYVTGPVVPLLGVRPADLCTHPGPLFLDGDTSPTPS